MWDFAKRAVQTVTVGNRSVPLLQIVRQASKELLTLFFPKTPDGCFDFFNSPHRLSESFPSLPAIFFSVDNRALSETLAMVSMLKDCERVCVAVCIVL